jgi:DegV family protein with EDD domain
MSASFALIIASCCDLPLELIPQDTVKTLCFNYILDGNSYPDDFFQSTTPHEFYQAMREGASPSTSQASPADIEHALRGSAEAGRDVVYLCMAGALSSNFSSACALSDLVKADYPDVTFHIIDSRTASVAEGLLILEAIRKYQEEDLSAEEFAAWGERARSHVHNLFMVDDLATLRRGGRIPASVAVAGAALNVKPLLEIGIDGSLGVVGASRGRAKAIKKMTELVNKTRDHDAPATICIGHADCHEEAEKLREAIAKNHSDANIIISDLGMTIGSHVGPGMLIVSFWGPNRLAGKRK